MFATLRIECLEERQMMSLGSPLAHVVLPVDSYEPDNSAWLARNISTSGSPLAHSLHAGSDVDWVRFTLRQRSHLVIETDGPAGDTEMWLYGRPRRAG